MEVLVIRRISREGQSAINLEGGLMSAASHTVKEKEYIKLELLKAYLEPLFMIIGQKAPRVCYVDCSAEPWGKDGQKPESTPVAVSLGIIEKCHNALSEQFRKYVQFRALFIERDSESFDRLENFLKTESWSGVDANCLKGDFCDLQKQILSWCGDRDFCLYFIDAAEWRHIALQNLGPLMARPSSEFLMNLLFDSTRSPRGLPSLEEHMKAVLGGAPGVSGDAALEGDRLLTSLYRRELKACAPIIGGAIPRCAHMRVLPGGKSRTVSELVYLTWDPLGVVAFMEASERLENEQRKMLALAVQSEKVKRSRQLEIFSADKLIGDSTSADPAEVKEYWLARLSSTPKQFGVSEFADMLEETGWFMDDFQKAFLDLEREGKVRNLGSTGMRTGNPVRYWLNGNRGELLEKTVD